MQISLEVNGITGICLDDTSIGFLVFDFITYWHSYTTKCMIFFSLVSLFNGISTFMGYLMSKPTL